MKKNKRVLGSDLIKVDAHVIQPEEYDELPEWTEKMFQQADLYEGTRLIRRGRPRKPVRAKNISLRLAPNVERYFRAGGKGWQTRINAALMDWIGKHPQ